MTRYFWGRREFVNTILTLMCSKITFSTLNDIQWVMKFCWWQCSILLQRGELDDGSCDRGCDERVPGGPGPGSRPRLLLLPLPEARLRPRRPPLPLGQVQQPLRQPPHARPQEQALPLIHGGRGGLWHTPLNFDGSIQVRTLSHFFSVRFFQGEESLISLEG